MGIRHFISHSAIACVITVIASSQLSAEETTPLEPLDPDKTYDITFDDVKLEEVKEDMVFKRSMLTPRAKQLDGIRVRLRGYIFPGSTFTQRNIKQFILIRNLQCKFGEGGQMHHNMVVELSPDNAIDFTTRPITVEGVLKIRPQEGPDGNTWSIYQLRG